MNKEPETPEEQAAQDALEELHQAVKKYAQARADMEGNGQIMVTASFVGYETASFEEDGDPVYRIKYTYTAPLSMSAALGVVHLVNDCVEEDLLGAVEE